MDVWWISSRLNWEVYFFQQVSYKNCCVAGIDTWPPMLLNLVTWWGSSVKSEGSSDVWPPNWCVVNQRICPTAAVSGDRRVIRYQIKKVRQTDFKRIKCRCSSYSAWDLVPKFWTENCKWLVVKRLVAWRAWLSQWRDDSHTTISWWRLVLNVTAVWVIWVAELFRGGLRLSPPESE